MNDFLRGFANATGLSTQEADEQWAAFSRMLDNTERASIEDGGEESGEAEGRRFREMYPAEEHEQA